MNDPIHDHVPVLICGAGPAGLAAAITLGLNGVAPVVVDSKPGTSTHPKATALMQRTMELFRAWGVEDAIRTRGLPERWSQTHLWKRSLFGPVLHQLDLRFGADSPQRRLSPTPAYACPQTETEAVLVQRVRSFPGARIHFDSELAALNQDDDGVTVTLRDIETDRARRIRCDYLIAADGAGSDVRTLLDIPLEGPGDLGRFVSIYHEADYGALLGEQRALLYEVFGRDSGGVFQPVDGRFGWLYYGMLEEGETRESFTEEHSIRRIRQCLGAPDIAINVLSTSFWLMSAAIANRWRNGRIFLTGDSAARTTPVGGVGMNTAIASAHNLAWKVAAVVRGWGGPELLSTYETERRPVTELNVGGSQTGGQALLRVIEASADEDEAALREAIVANAPGKSRIGQDLGYTYTSAAIVPDGTKRPAVADPVAEYAPSACPGSRAPHLWIWHQGLRISTLDLFAKGLTLLVGPEGRSWCEAARHLAKDADWPLTAYTVGPEGDLTEHRGNWCDLYGVSATGAVLVRPDGFVAWRCAEAPADRLAALAEALEAATLREAVGAKEEVIQ